jgi:hypothetical protein
VWDGPARPPVYPPSPANTVQVIKTRFGHTITLDDTPGAAKVSVAHVNGSQVSMTADGNVAVTAVKDLNLKAGGDITLQATNVTVTVATAMTVG